MSSRSRLCDIRCGSVRREILKRYILYEYGRGRSLSANVSLSACLTGMMSFMLTQGLPFSTSILMYNNTCTSQGELVIE
jgi:hypothetical protein